MDRNKLERDFIWTFIGFSCMFAPGVIFFFVFQFDLSNVSTIYAIIIALYTAFYGMAWAQYEYQNNRQRQQLSIIAALMATEYRMDFVPQLATLTKEVAPIRPTWFSFRQIAYSAFRRYDRGNPFLYYNQGLISDAAALIRGFSGWSHADFERIILIHANLERSDLSFTKLTFANLEHTILKYANMDNTLMWASSFSRANLQYAKIRNSRAHNTVWTYARLEGVDFSNSDLKGADLTSSGIGLNIDDEPLHTCFQNTILSLIKMNPVNVWAPGYAYGLVGDDCTNDFLIQYLASLLQCADTLYEAQLPLPVYKLLNETSPHLFTVPSSHFKTTTTAHRPNTPLEDEIGRRSHRGNKLQI